MNIFCGTGECFNGGVQDVAVLKQIFHGEIPPLYAQKKIETFHFLIIGLYHILKKIDTIPLTLTA